MAYYRVIEGKHFADGPKGCDCPACAFNVRERERVKEEKKKGNDYIPRFRDHIYKKGDIVQTDYDLLSLNQGSRSMKFEMVDSIGRPKSSKPRTRKSSTVSMDEVDVGDGLDDMTVDELRAMASEEEIDLGAEIRKNAIIKEIRQAMTHQAVEAGFNS